MLYEWCNRIMKIKNKMNYQDKTKSELIKELQKLQKEYDSLKTSYEKDITEHKQAESSLEQVHDW